MGWAGATLSPSRLPLLFRGIFRVLPQGHMKIKVPQKALEYEPMDLEQFAAERAEGSAANLRRPLGAPHRPLGSTAVCFREGQP